MDFGYRFIDDFRAFFVKIVYYLINTLFVTGNGRSGNNYSIVISYLNLIVVAGSHSRERAHRLALAARRDDDHLLHAVVVDLVDIDNRAFRRRDVAKLERDVDDVDHAAAEHGDVALVAHSRVDDLLDAVDVGGEGRDDDALLAALEEAVEGSSHGALAHRVAGALNVR